MLADTLSFQKRIYKSITFYLCTILSDSYQKNYEFKTNQLSDIFLIEKSVEEFKTCIFSFTYRSVSFIVVYFATNVNCTIFICNYY